ncbi:MAG: EAL domain-containing protein [Rhodoferax sp.]|uniref:EAL domain-containing protein n=1 Tax=Rhodoferax sp. TaxID=50421 RepID=UPI0032665CB9
MRGVNAAAPPAVTDLMGLSRFLGRYPRAVGIVSGYVVGLAMALSVVLVALQVRLQAIDSGHAQVIASMQDLQTDLRKLLDELNASYAPVCTPDNLNRLRSLMFTYRYARDIGLLNPQRQLFCTTNIGLLASPSVANEGGIEGSIGHYYLHAPLPLSQGTVQAAVVERGRFQVVMQPNSTQDTRIRYADAVWAGRANQRTRVYQSARSAWLDPLVTPQTPHLHLGAGHIALLVTNTLPGVSPISVQSVLLPQDLYQNQAEVLFGAALVCLLLGLLVQNAVTLRCQHFQSMAYRIRFLCQPANVVCHYQPIMDLASGRTIGCEVLARLDDAGQLVYPDHFIPALIADNRTWAFDAAVSTRALQELGAALPARDVPFKVALNFFPQNLQRDAIEPHLRASLLALGRTDLHVELEVTEYNFSPEIVPELQRLKADGYYISIDDFGTGYSNLGMVKRVAPDFLKIDKSFVFEMEDASLRSSLIPEIIAIAKAVHSEVVAEGIENAAQVDQLRAMGVPFGQGYYFAKPMPLEAFLAYLRACDEATEAAEAAKPPAL